MAGALEGGSCLRSAAATLRPRVLLPGDAAVPVGQAAYGPCAELFHRRRGGPVPGDARTGGPAPDGLGLLRSAGRKRRDQARDPSRDMDSREHRGHGGAAAEARPVVRLDSRDRRPPARLLSLESVVLPEDVRARSGLSQPPFRQLVRLVPDRPRERAGRERALLALRFHCRADRAGPVVPQNHRLRRRARRRARLHDRLARTRPRHAAQLDRQERRGGRPLPARRRGGPSRGGRDRNLHDPPGHHLRRHLLRRGAAAPRPVPHPLRERGAPAPGRVPAPHRHARRDARRHGAGGEGRDRHRS